MVNVITLPERTNRMEVFIAQAKVQRFLFRIWDGVKGGSPKTNISQAHKQVIRNAKAKGLPFCIVAEDDVQFTCKTAYKHYTDNMPDEFDIYFGGVSGGTIKSGNVSFFSGMFLYTVHERFYDAFLAADENCNIDRWFSNLGIKKITEILGRPPVYKVCYPMVAITSNGYSDNFGKEMDYSRYFRNYKLYIE